MKQGKKKEQFHIKTDKFQTNKFLTDPTDNPKLLHLSKLGKVQT